MIQFNGLTLAYIGDAVYELLIREYLISTGLTKVDHLHKEAIKYTSAIGQAGAFDKIEADLTEKEFLYFKKGRNAKSDRKARNASLADYKKATGFEAIIGYLHIEKDSKRLEEILEMIVKEK
jgi:ribonuclease-3 family protein